MPESALLYFRQSGEQKKYCLKCFALKTGSQESKKILPEMSFP